LTTVDNHVIRLAYFSGGTGGSKEFWGRKHGVETRLSGANIRQIKVNTPRNPRSCFKVVATVSFALVIPAALSFALP
jgi:hypothetical protein